MFFPHELCMLCAFWAQGDFKGSAIIQARITCLEIVASNPVKVQDCENVFDGWGANKMGETV